MVLFFHNQRIPVADPGFPSGGGATYYSTKLCENCMKMKKIGPGGEATRPQFYYVDSPLYS